MRTNLVYTAPAAVHDSLDDPVRDPKVAQALDGLACLQGSALEHLDAKFPDRDELRGGFLRLVWDGKKLAARIEIDSPRLLKKPELAVLREALDGQVMDGIGEGAFDFVGDEAGVSVTLFPDLGSGKSTLVQTAGEAWRPAKKSVETAANRKRCKAAADAIKAAEKARAKKAGKADPKKLFKLIQKTGAAAKKEVAAEIARLGSDLSFIKSGQMPYDLLHDAGVLRLLLDAGLDPNLCDKEGHTLLWLASGQISCVTLLLDRGADPNLRGEYPEETALMRAAWLGELDEVRLLIARGADPALKDFHQKTALDHARDRAYGEGIPETIRYLQGLARKKAK
jgi:hypothetical protein